MLPLLREMVAHNDHANVAILDAVRRCDPAIADPAIQHLLHHILLAHRFWLSVILDRPFDANVESRTDASMEALASRYARTRLEQSAWIDAATDPSLERVLEHAMIPAGRCSVGRALVQVCLHSHGHRAQCATRLRALGGAPPVLDFIAWVTDRPVTQTT